MERKRSCGFHFIFTGARNRRKATVKIRFLSMIQKILDTFFVLNSVITIIYNLQDNYDSYPRCGSSGGTLQMSSGCCTPCSSSQQRESIIPDIAMASSSMSSLCLSQQHKAISISSPWISGAGSSSSR